MGAEFGVKFQEDLEKVPFIGRQSADCVEGGLFGKLIVDHNRWVEGRA